MNAMRFIMLLNLLLAYLASSMINPMPEKVEAASLQRGPRAPRLEIIFKPDSEAMYAALIKGEIEYMTTGLSAAQYEDAITRPEIIVVPVTAFTIVNEAFQSNYTIPSFSNWRNPMNDVSFRKAVLHLVDKDWIVNSVYRGFAGRIDVPIAAPSRGWMNESVIGPNYPYPYSPVLAIEHLEDPAVYGKAENGWYDYDHDGTRNYPLDWPGLAGNLTIRDEPNIHPLDYWIYDSPPERYDYAHALAEELRNIGIPVNEHVAPFTLVNDQCFCAYNYHITSDGWSVGRFPTYLEFFFHSDYWIPGYCGSNCYTGDNEPWTAEIDAAVATVRYAKTVDESKQACSYAQSLIMDKYALWLPICSPKVFYAYRNLVGVVPMEGFSPWNDYTEMNAFRTDDPTEPIRIASSCAPAHINPIYLGMSESALLVTGSTWDNCINLNPHDAMREQPGLYQDWETTTWDGGNHTLCKIWLINEANWIEPITGNVLAPFTTEDLEFSLWYLYNIVSWWWDIPLSIHHVRTDPNNPYYIEYYWDRLSFLFYLPEEWPWFDIDPCARMPYHENCKRYPIVQDPDHPGQPGPAVKTFVEGVNMTTPGDLPLPYRSLYAPVEIVSIVQEGAGPLKPSDVDGGWDYEMVKGRIHIYKDLPDGAKITVTYWARGKAGGTTLGGLPWYETMVGTGPWYMTSWNITKGATYRANRHHMWTTPPLGETDWYWWRIEGAKPRGGYMQINIYDVVVATGAYGTQGRYTPDATFTPTADLAPSADGLPGKIDIYDVTTITVQYGARFWNSPPP